MGKIRSFFWQFISIFCLLFVITFESPYSIFPPIYSFINPFFENLIYWTGTEVFGINNDFNTTISSDSIGLYIHVFNLFFISILLAFTWELIYKIKSVNLRKYFFIISSYYIALQLLIYGLDKIFKGQFFMPEPNTLFTNLGELTPDLLYWSTIGSSWNYSFFIGFIEVLVTCLLLISRTRLIGIILGIGVMVNVVAVNFSYDISVKIYSLFLLGILVVNFIPYITYLYKVLVLKKPAKFNEVKVLFLSKKPLFKKGMKTVIIVLFFTEALFPYLKYGNWNDDTSSRPIFHGAYQIISPKNKPNYTNWKQVFVHRKGYLIVKNKQNEMQDYHLSIDTINQILNLDRYDNNTSFKLNYNQKNNSFTHLFGDIENQKIDVLVNKINLKNLPLLNSKFHWTTEHNK